MSISISKSIAAPPAEVFDQITDLRHAAERIEDIVQIEVLTDGPIGVGTRFRETRMMFGKQCTEEMEVTQFDAPRSYTVEAESCGALMISKFEVEPDGDGSRVLMKLESRPLTLMARLIMPISGWMLSGMMKKCIEKDLDNIKSAMEVGAA